MPELSSDTATDLDSTDLDSTDLASAAQPRTRGTVMTKAVIPAAGLGTRFLPATKATPKEMLPIVDKPAIQLVVEEAVSAGLTDVLMVTGRSKRALEDHFDRAAELEHVLATKGDTATPAFTGNSKLVSA